MKNTDKFLIRFWYSFFKFWKKRLSQANNIIKWVTQCIEIYIQNLHFIKKKLHFFKVPPATELKNLVLFHYVIKFRSIFDLRKQSKYQPNSIFSYVTYWIHTYSNFQSMYYKFFDMWMHFCHALWNKSVR